jgi:hypothetical protein
VLIIHARAEPHRGHTVDTAGQEAAGRLMRMPQPAYAPALNPQERMGKWRRRVVTHNQRFETLREAIQAMRTFFSSLIGRKAEGQRLCAIKTPESLFASL